MDESKKQIIALNLYDELLLLLPLDADKWNDTIRIKMRDAIKAAIEEAAK
jgi:hypothetical protein